MTQRKLELLTELKQWLLEKQWRQVQISSTENGLQKNFTDPPRWVTDNWKKSYDECYTNFSDGPEEVLSQESKEIVEQATGKKRRSCREISKEILAKRQKKISHVSIHKVMLFFN